MSKKNNVLVNSFLYTFSSLLVKAMTFFLLPVYTKFLSPNDYGTVNLINSFIHVATFIVSFSLYNAIIRFYADYKNDKEKLKIFFGTIIIFIFFSGIVFSLLGIIFKEILLLVFKDIPFYPVVLIAILTLLFSSLHTAHQNMLQGMQQGKKLTIVNLIVFANQVCLNLVFIWFFKLEATGVLLYNN